jgi:hypothetical protein
MQRRLGPDPESQAGQLRKIKQEVSDTVMDYPRLRARAQAYLDPDQIGSQPRIRVGLETIFEGLQVRLAPHHD